MRTPSRSASVRPADRQCRGYACILHIGEDSAARGVLPWRERTHPGPLDLNRDGALEQVNGEHEALAALFGHNQPFEANQWAELDAHGISDAQVGPRESGELRLDNGADGGDFAFVNGLRHAAAGDDMFDAPGGEHGKTAVDIEAAEQIAGKERSIYFLDTTGIPAALRIGWQEHFISLAA